MLHNLVGRVPLQRVNLQHPRDQLLGRVTDFVPVRRIELKNSTQDLIEELLLVVGTRGEGWVADQEDVHDDPGGPDVDLNPVSGFGKYFRCDIGRGSTDGEERFRNKLGQSKVTQLEGLEALADVLLVVLVHAQVDNLEKSNQFCVKHSCYFTIHINFPEEGAFKFFATFQN